MCLMKILREYGCIRSTARYYQPTNSILLRHFSGVLRLGNEVHDALRSNTPVVALESTIISHGMPYPNNIRMAQSVEQIVRNHGCVPATIALLDGAIHVGGLSEEQLHRLGNSNEVLKVSRRDVAMALCKKIAGGTTISATMMLAHMAGIEVFVSGGLGGVHRGGESSMDVSADLMELGRTPVAVVTSGVKSILDIGKTLEVLETQGVCVATFGEYREFPAFFSARSGYKSPHNVATVDEAAQLIYSNLQLQTGNGVLLGVPIPKEYEYDGEQVEKVIVQALNEAKNEEIAGRDVTPYVLKRVHELTGGKSVIANIALVENNAKVGSQIAKRLSEIKAEKADVDGSGTFTRSHVPKQPKANNLRRGGHPVVIGACNLDTVMHLQHDPRIDGGVTNPCQARQTFGGVGRNVADAMSRLGQTPILLSMLGADVAGNSMIEGCPHMDWSHVDQSETGSTAQYTVVLHASGEVFMGLGDMEIHNQITPNYIESNRDLLEECPLMVLDGNLSVPALRAAGKLARNLNIPVFYEPTDAQKACKALEADVQIHITKPNLHELEEIYTLVTGASLEFADSTKSDQLLIEASEAARTLSEHIPNILVSLGANGAVLCMRRSKDNSLSKHKLHLEPTQKVLQESRDFIAIHMPVVPISGIKSLSGAGDCFSGAFLSRMLESNPPTSCLRSAVAAAKLSAQSYLTVPPSLPDLKC